MTRVVNLQMRWCISCHDEPEKHLRPPDQIFNMEWHEPADQLDAGQKAAVAVQHSKRTIAELFRSATGEPWPEIAQAKAADGRGRTRNLRPAKPTVRSRPLTGGHFCGLDGRSAALAGAGQLTGCWKPQPLEWIVPYVDEPEGVIPGIPRFYASAIPVGGFACGFGRGVIVEQHEGRPTKIEGNPLHPSSLGATDMFMQASILQLYDPDRSGTPQRGHDAITWGGVLEGLRDFVRARGGPAKVRLRILTGTVVSPMLASQIAVLGKIFPQFQWHVHDVLAPANMRAGQRQAFSTPVTPVYDFTRIRRIVSIDSAFLAEEAGGTGAAVRICANLPTPAGCDSRNLARIRRTLPPGKPVESPRRRIGRRAAQRRFDATVLYGAKLGQLHRGARRSSAADHAGNGNRGFGGHRGGAGIAPGTATPGTSPGTELPKNAAPWVAAAAADLKTAGPAGIVLVGEYLPPQAHALGYAINAALRQHRHRRQISGTRR